MTQKIPTLLKEGYKRFRKGRFRAEKQLFEELSKGQNPKIMVVTCADSRVYATEIFDAHAGDLFVIRNIAGLVPPFHGVEDYLSTAAALEFAVEQLNVKHILVLGHQHCGGIRVCADCKNEGHIGAWVKQLKALREKIWDNAKNEQENLQNLEQASVKRSLDNLITYPFVQNAISSGTLSIHGGWISLAEAKLYWLEDETFSLCL